MINGSVDSAFETIKEVLKHIHEPETLDHHMWAQSLIVKETLKNNPQLAQMNAGQQLTLMVAGVFREFQPANPPRRGKRLDPRWGEFGLLAALYFMPFERGLPFPTSLLDAWGRIDSAILYYAGLTQGPSELTVNGVVDEDNRTTYHA